MPQITLTITAGGNPLGRTKQISAGDLKDRWIPAHRAMYQMARMSTDPQMSDDDVVQHWADEILQRMKQRIQDYERQTLNVTPIDLT